MRLRATVTLAFLALAGPGMSATATLAADLPPVKATEKNKVPSCATPGRLMAFLKDRNEKLDNRFDGIATEYMRHGEELGIRWDIAFFQMILETGNLSFTGDVKPRQNNFAGLGATGNGEPGESFKDVSTGVRAHLEHLLMYTGEKIANPVAERTRKVQEWGVLTEWQKSIKGPVTFAQLAKKWAPPARKYAADIETVAEHFTTGACKAADPRPELVLAARKALLDEATSGAQAANAATLPAASTVPKAAAAVSGVEAAKRSVEAAKNDGAGRSALGASAVAKTAPLASEKVETTEAAAPKIFTLINPVKPEEAPTASSGAQAASPSPAETPAATKVAAAPAAAAVKPAKGVAREAAPKEQALKEQALKEQALKDPGKCNVFTASYGGQKSVIIKVVAADSVNYTVLDVNEGAESRETEAYIAAYAKGGRKIEEFASQSSALERAFQLCPEG